MVYPHKIRGEIPKGWYDRNCDVCGEHYVGQGERFCSNKCSHLALKKRMIVPHHPKHYKYFPEKFDRTELEAMFYRQKLSYKDIGLSYGMSEKAITKIMDELGFPRRKVGELTSIRMKGVPKSQEHREKHRQLLKIYNPMGNKSKTPVAIAKWKATRQARDNFKWSDEQKKRSSRYWLNFYVNNPDCLIKRGLSLNIRPNLPEQMILGIINKLKLPYKYTGNFGFWIEGKNPDFVNTNGQKKIIECWGVHWHTEKELKQRDFLFRQYGYKTLFIWDYELKDLLSIEQKIVEFERGG